MCNLLILSKAAIQTSEYTTLAVASWCCVRNFVWSVHNSGQVSQKLKTLLRLLIDIRKSYRKEVLYSFSSNVFFSVYISFRGKREVEKILENGLENFVAKKLATTRLYNFSMTFCPIYLIFK